MNESERLLTLFSGAVELRDGKPVVEIPGQELELGALSIGETYRIAILRQEAASTGSSGDRRKNDGRRSSESSRPPVEEGERYEIEIEDLGEQGDGIARVGPGYIVFVPGTGIGDRVTVEIVEARANFAFADVVEDEPISG